MQAAAMRTRIGKIALVTALVATLLGVLPGGAAQAGSFDGHYRNRWEMLRATNGSRYNHDLRRVDLQKHLSDLARKHSLAMAKADSLFHVQDPSRYYLKGIKWHYWGENVGVTGGTVTDLERAFMASTDHRHNVLNRIFRHVAIGAVRVDGTLWVTVFFYG